VLYCVRQLCICISAVLTVDCWFHCRFSVDFGLLLCFFFAILFLCCLFLLWPPCVAHADIIFLPCGFYPFPSPNLSGRSLDVYRTSTRWCGLCANLECMFEMCSTWLAGNTGRKKLPFWHHHTTLLGCIFAAKACIDKQKKNLLNIDTSSTRPHNMVNFGLLTAEICWRVWDTPANFNGFCVLAALLTAWHSSSGHQPNFAALNRGRHLYSAGRPSRWALTHILVVLGFVSSVLSQEIG